MKQPANNLDFDPRQLIGCREVAALLGVSERTLRAGGEYQALLSRSFWLGKFRKWQAGFVYEWIAEQQRRAIEQAEALEERQRELSNVVSIDRPRKPKAQAAPDLWAEARAAKAAREKRLAARAAKKLNPKPKPKRVLYGEAKEQLAGA